MEPFVRAGLAGLLLLAAAMKLRAPRSAAEAMATYGFRSPAARWAAFVFVVLAESALAVGVIAGSDRAAYGACALTALFALTLGSAMMQGKAGRPCGCFGAGSSVGWIAIVRNAALAIAFAVIPSLPG